MLAQNFKTPEALGISGRDFGALVRTLGMLERREIPKHLFCMGQIGRPECGTPGCILGWARFGDRSLLKVGDLPAPLGALFYPGRSDADYAYSARVEQAAIALRNYLTHGEPRWAEAMTG